MSLFRSTSAFDGGWRTLQVIGQDTLSPFSPPPETTSTPIFEPPRVAAKVRLYRPPHLRAENPYWRRFPGFDPQPQSAIASEFNRLARFMKWDENERYVRKGEAYGSELAYFFGPKAGENAAEYTARKIKIMKTLLIDLGVVKDHGGEAEKDLDLMKKCLRVIGRALEEILDLRMSLEFGEESKGWRSGMPRSARKCMKALQPIHVNLVNLINHHRNPDIPIIKFDSRNHFIAYTKKAAYPRDAVKRVPWLRILLEALAGRVDKVEDPGEALRRARDADPYDDEDDDGMSMVVHTGYWV